MTSTYDAAAVAKLLYELGQRMSLRGGNPYRARAYMRAAESLMALTMLTVGASFAATKDGCCDGSLCCNGSPCCQQSKPSRDR